MARTRGIEFVKPDGGERVSPAAQPINLSDYRQVMTPPSDGTVFILRVADVVSDEHTTASDVLMLMARWQRRVRSLGNRRGLVLSDAEFRDLPKDCRTHFRPDSSGTWDVSADDVVEPIADGDPSFILDPKEMRVRSLEPCDLLNLLLAGGHRPRVNGCMVFSLDEFASLPPSCRRFLRERQA